MNIAERYLEYYESEDFEGQYAYFLSDEAAYGAESLQSAWNFKQVWAYFWERPPLGLSFMNSRTAEAVWEALYFDSAQYRRFNGYWVGPYCLGSISFGEQEVQLEGITNHRTGREYSARYLCQVFQDEGFCVSDCGRYAYLDLTSEGVYIDFRDFEKETIFKALEGAKARGLF